MKNFSKLTTILGGALLTVGCGGSDVVGGSAEVVAAPDAQIKLSAVNPTSVTDARADQLVGYYSGCEGFKELAEWKIRFGSGGSGSQSSLKLTKGDTGCTLTATAFWYAPRTFSASNTDGTPSADAKQYKFYRVDNPTQLASIPIETVSNTNPWNQAYAVIARLSNGTGMPDTTVAAESTMVNVGAYNIDASTNAIKTGPLQFKDNFKIMTITGTAGSLTNATGDARFIGYASMTGSPTSQVKAPAYVQGAIDATIFTNSNNVVITSDKSFRLNKGADAETGGTEYTYSLPGYRLEHNDVAGTPVTDTSFAALTDGQKYELLRLAFDNVAGNQGNFPLNPSASAITIPASSLYPIGTDLSVDYTGNFSDPQAPLFDNADLSARRTVVLIARRDPKSGVRSFQAVYIRLILNTSGQ